MNPLQEITSYFDVTRQQNQCMTAKIDDYFSTCTDIHKYKGCKELSREVFTKFLSEFLHDCAFLLNQEQEEKILKELNANSLGGSIDLDIWKALFRYWLRKDTKPVSAFVAVDVQNDFISGSLALRNCPAKQEGEDVVTVINNLKNSFKFDFFFYTLDWHPPDHCSFFTNVTKYPLHSVQPTSAESAKVFDTVVYDGEYGREQILWPPHCIQGSTGAELHKDLKISSTDIKIYKGKQPFIDSYSAFWDNGKLSQTNLLVELLNRNVTHVFIGGLATDYCVAFTSLDCAEHGFETYIVDEACRGVSEESISNMTAKMVEAGVKKINVDQIKDHLPC